jgi:hypothetical protein
MVVDFFCFFFIFLFLSFKLLINGLCIWISHTKVVFKIAYKDLIFINVVSFKYGLIIHDDFVFENLSIVYKIRLHECVYLILFIVHNLLSY